MIIITPLTSKTYEISMPGQSINLDASQVPAMLEALKDQAPGQTEVIIEFGGLKTETNILEKALELAGLSSFEAAKQQATGKVVF